MPSSNIKTIHLIRHGVALHNVRDAQGERVNLLDPMFTDPPLVRQGELQAQVLGEQLKRRGMVASDNADVGSANSSASGGGVTNDGDGMDTDENDNNNNINHKHQPAQSIELVVCSPLTRCLQTASHIFPSHFNRENDGADAASSTSSEQQNNENDLHHVLDRNCRVCCHGDVREAYGMHYPDKRSQLSHLKSKFPTVKYHPHLTENDIDWQPSSRETRHDVLQRVHKFFIWLMHQPHDNIAIVTHGVWMETALLNYCPEVLDRGNTRVYNCDVYRGQLLLAGGSMSGNDYAGGSGVEFRDVEKIVFYPTR